MAHHIIPESPQFSAEVRKFETTDRNHADVLNRPIAALIENDHFLKSELGKKADKEETNKIYTATELAQKTLQNGQMYFVKVSKGQTLEQIGQYSIFKENSGQVTSLKGGTQTDKVYSVYYDSAKNGFFMKASATGTAAADHVLANKTFSSEADTDQVGTMPNRGTWNATLGSDGQVIIPDGYHSGAGKVKAHTVSGRTIIPGRTEQIAIEAGKLATGDIRISGDSNLHAGNIRHGSNVFGINGSFTSDATAETYHLLEGKTAYVRGQKIIGTQPWRGNQIQSVTPSRQNQRVSIQGGIHQGGGYIDVVGDSDLIPANIRQGTNLFGVQGNYDGGRSQIANALTNKGVPTSTSATAEQIVEKIKSARISIEPLRFTTNESYSRLTELGGAVENVRIDKSSRRLCFDIVIRKSNLQGICLRMYYNHNYTNGGAFLLPKIYKRTSGLQYIGDITVHTTYNFNFNKHNAYNVFVLDGAKEVVIKFEREIIGNYRDAFDDYYYRDKPIDFQTDFYKLFVLENAPTEFSFYIF